MPIATPMTHYRLFALLACLWLGAAPLAATEAARAIQWGDLVDAAAQDFEDPFLALSADQISDLVEIVRRQNRMTDETLTQPDRDALRAEIDGFRARLAAEGVEADALLAQRQTVAQRRAEAAWAANAALDGARITLSGFLVVTRHLESQEIVGYLVPEFGMCSHIPPPSPNQLVKLGALDPETLPELPYGYVEVSGVLRNVKNSDLSMVIDGTLDMHSAWTVTQPRLTAPSDAQPHRNRILR